MAEIETPKWKPILITFLSSLLQQVADSNDFHHPLQTQKISAFHGLTRPTISIQSYLERIFKYANCSLSCYIVAYIYLDRFKQRQPDFAVNSFNVHRLLITSVMISAKFMDDIYFSNAYYAKVGGISTREINFLEVDFLFGLGFHLNVTPTTFFTYCSYLHREVVFYPHLDIGQEPSLLYTSGRSSQLHLYLSDQEDSSHQHQQQLAV